MEIINGDNTHKMSGFDGLVFDGDRQISDDVDVHDLVVEGKVCFHEDVDADNIAVSGSAEFCQYLICDNINVNGTCLARAGFASEKADVKGSLTVYGAVKSERVICSGVMDVLKTSKMWNLKVEGKLFIRDTLKFDKAVINGMIDVNDKASGINLYICSAMPSVIQRVVVDNLTVESDGSNRNMDKIFLLESDSADCDYAYIECCKINRLYCKSGRIGDYCNINELYYTDTVDISERAKVQKCIKL